MKTVYALDMSNGTVKIGVTQNLAQRIARIEGHSGLIVLRHFESKTFSDGNAFAIERACHKTFAAERTNGEFFAIKFEDAVAEIERRVDDYPDNPAELSDREKIQFLLEAAKLAAGAMRERFLLKVEMLIDGRDLDDFDDAPVADFTAEPTTNFVEDFIDKQCVRVPQARLPRPQLVRLIRERCPEAANTSNKTICSILSDIPGLGIIKSHGTICLKGIRLIDDNED